MLWPKLKFTYFPGLDNAIVYRFTISTRIPCQLIELIGSKFIIAKVNFSYMASTSINIRTYILEYRITKEYEWSSTYSVAYL